MNSYNNFTQAYIDLCRQINDNSEFMSSPRGMKIKEKLGVQFRIKNIRDRLPYVEARNFSLSYFVAESIWYMSGNNSTEWISHYAPFWKNISDDGKTANSAYGARIFKTHPQIGNGEIVQWDYVKNELLKDPDSRRAVIHIRVPDDSLNAMKDVPCTLSLQFFIRANKLHLHVNMRSSDIILGLVYDVPAFTLMQEVMANELEVDVGEYCHTSNSLHCYEKDFAMLDNIAKSDDSGVRPPMSPLPKVFPTDDLFKMEKSVRESSKGEIKDGLISINLHPNDSLNLVKDWAFILYSSRARKMKEEKLSQLFIYSTNDNCYHFFKR